MATAYFLIKLTVTSGQRGEAKLSPPPAFESLDLHFIAVKEGGGEGIVRVEGPDSLLKKLEKESNRKRLTPSEADELKKKYPPPKLKRKYRPRPQPTGANAPGIGQEMYELDAAGRPVVDTFQTVRSGFYLIDVPVHDTD